MSELSLAEKIKNTYGLEIGDPVIYSNGFKKERGIIKSLSDINNVFVVYNCGDNWENYENYTAARAPIKHLTKI